MMLLSAGIEHGASGTILPPCGEASANEVVLKIEHKSIRVLGEALEETTLFVCSS
jgi:hypothetical protein